MQILKENTTNKIFPVKFRRFTAATRNFHWHENYEICLVRNKPCRFMVEGEIINADAGDIVMVDGYVVHQFIVDYPDTDIGVLQFDASCFVNQEVSFESVKTHITKKEIENIPGLQEKIDAVVNIIASEEGIVENVKENPFLQSLVAALYYLLMRYFPTEKGKSHEKKDRQEFYRVVEFIKENYTEELSVNSIAENVYMSRGKMTRLFDKYAGMKPGDYVNKLRINRANYMLSEGKSISEAAMESGFQSLRTFNDVYKKHMGITPTEFMKKNK